MCTDTGKVRTRSVRVSTGTEPFALSALCGLSSYCVSAFYWQSLSPAKRDYKYNPRIANRTVDAFCSASCPSCYHLCHDNDHQNSIAWISSPLLLGTEGLNLDEFVVSLLAAPG